MIHTKLLQNDKFYSSFFVTKGVGSMERIFEGVAGKLHISEPELFVDNESRRRSGHMSHAMVEYEPGRIIAFNSNCSPDRLLGHAAHG